MYKLFFFIFGLLLGAEGIAQNQDSLKKIILASDLDSKQTALIELIKSYENRSPDSAQKYAYQLLEISIQKNDNINIAIAYSKIGKSAYYLDDFATALDAWNNSLNYYKICNHDEGIAENLNSIGSYYYKMSEYSKALDYYLESLSLREKINDSVGIAYSLNNIGNVHYSQNLREKAIELYENALKIATKTTDTKIISILLNNLGSEYANKKEYEKALKYHFQSVELKTKTNNTIGLGITFGSIGSIYKYQNQYDSALFYYSKALDIFEKVSNKYHIALIYNYIAAVHEKEGKNTLAIEFLEKSLNLAESIDAMKIKEMDFIGLSAIYEKLNNFQKAYQYQKLYVTTHDSIFNEENAKRIKELQIKYETEKKEKENDILKKEKTIKDLQISRKNLLIYLLMGLSGLIFIFMTFLINRNRFRQKLNLLLEEKNSQLHTANQKLIISENNLKNHVESKDKFFSIIAHDLRSPLSSLSIVSEMLDNNIESLSKEKLKYYINSISNATGSLLNLVENLLNWARTQTGKISFNPDKIVLRDIVMQNLLLMRISAEKKSIRIKTEIPENISVWADINLLTAILRNIISNAIKFNKDGGQINISASKNVDYVEIRIEDSGIGISQIDIHKLFRIDVDYKTIGNSSEKGTGLGLLLCKEFTEKNGGTIAVESIEGQGTTFILTFKKQIE